MEFQKNSGGELTLAASFFHPHIIISGKCQVGMQNPPSVLLLPLIYAYTGRLRMAFEIFEEINARHRAGAWYSLVPHAGESFSAFFQVIGTVAVHKSSCKRSLMLCLLLCTARITEEYILVFVSRSGQDAILKPYRKVHLWNELKQKKFLSPCPF